MPLFLRRRDRGSDVDETARSWAAHGVAPGNSARTPPGEERSAGSRSALRCLPRGPTRGPPPSGTRNGCRHPPLGLATEATASKCEALVETSPEHIPFTCSNGPEYRLPLVQVELRT